MKIKKIPIRTCIVTREPRPKSELMRIVVDNKGIVSIDKIGKAPGRGAYLLLSREVVLKAKKTKALDKALETTIPESIYDDLLKISNE